MSDDRPVLYRASGPVTLVGGGPVPADRLAAALALAPEVVAADGGGDVALPGGARLRAAIGDMDSLAGAERLRAAGVPVHRIAEQDTTDLEKCLYSVEAPLYLAVGFLGGRLDHTLAALTALARRPAGRVLLIGAEDVAFLCPVRWQAALPAGARVSLWPLGPVEGRSGGLRWPIDGLSFRPDLRTGTSNEATGGPVSLEFDAPRMIVLLPADLLGLAVASVRGAG
ncbi:MAG: thiamine diphosphokinase [Amaricoccus sp.]|uniref:thiamine diphosphokinase n=1 Tax=Amaricoccus sp. TaxID=1872485 RepID=UPI0039E63050